MDLSYADVSLSTTRWTVTRSGRLVSLTPTEFRLLRVLLERPEQVLTWSEIAELVWQEDWPGARRTVDAHVGNLRRKLEVHGPRLIHNVRGVGYVLYAPSRTSQGPAVPDRA